MMPSVRRLLGRLYIAVIVFRLSAIIGKLWLAWYRLIYPDFQIGTRPQIWGRFKVMMLRGGAISIGDRFHVVSSAARSTITLYSPVSLTVFSSGRIVIGDDVGLNGTAITSKKSIRIGSGTMIAANTIIVDSDFHAQWPPDQRRGHQTGDDDRAVEVGANVWIGMNVTVLKGVTIGDNSIIGAGSVVSGPIPANVVAAGNPARVIRAIGAPPVPRELEEPK